MRTPAQEAIPPGLKLSPEDGICMDENVVFLDLIPDMEWVVDVEENKKPNQPDKTETVYRT